MSIIKYLLFMASASTFIVPNLVVYTHHFVLPRDVAFKYLFWLIATSPTFNNNFQMASLMWTAVSMAYVTPIVHANPVLILLALTMGSIGILKRIKDGN
jgi:hypothetical protein